MTGIERLSTHVLDVAAGRPAGGIPVTLHDEAGVARGTGVTDDDGRVAQLNEEPLAPGDLTLTYDTADYAARVHGTVFHPRITVHVRLDGARSHYHVPVLASPFSFSTYLGS